MLLEEEKQKLKKNINDLTRQIASDKKILSDLHIAKEKAFKEKDRLNAVLKDHIDQVKKLRPVDELKSAGSLRKERDKYNSQVQSIISQIKLLRTQASASDKQPSLGSLKSDIARLEESIEIEAFSYEQEQRVLERIKKLKRKYAENEKFNEVFSKINILSSLLHDIKEKADNAHKQLLDSLSSNKEKQKEYWGLSNKIIDIKKLQETAWKEFIHKKNEYIKFKNTLKIKIDQLSAIENKINTYAKTAKEIREKKEKELIKKKAKSVEEKFKKSGKLTTEDILIIQGTD
ncbi:MAG: hypothetical protein AABW49_04310 [Nanoarchaeota archaeon]